MRAATAATRPSSPRTARGRHPCLALSSGLERRRPGCTNSTTAASGASGTSSSVRCTGPIIYLLKCAKENKACEYNLGVILARSLHNAVSRNVSDGTPIYAGAIATLVYKRFGGGGGATCRLQVKHVALLRSTPVQGSRGGRRRPAAAEGRRTGRRGRTCGG